LNAVIEKYFYSDITIVFLNLVQILMFFRYLPLLASIIYIIEYIIQKKSFLTMQLLIHIRNHNL